jgi:peptidoglycan/LPS O-acetylase OafA/YrhL
MQSVSPTERSGGFRPDVEGLRGVAILLVVLYHAHLSFMHGGFVGVDVFFVISGYLITGLLVREVERSGSISFKGFYARRVRRLLPALAVTLAVTVVGAVFNFAPWNLGEVLKAGIASALWSANLYFAVNTTNYLAQDANSNPFLHMWSLAVEEQFYFVWPALIWLATRRWASRGKRRLLALLAAVAVFSFLGCLLLTYRNQPWAFFASPARSWEFALGGLAVLVRRPRWPRFCVVFPVLGLGAIALSAVAFSDATVFPGWAALLPVLGTAAVLTFDSAQGGVGWALNNPPMQLFGRLSYSWYLWHWPVLVLARRNWNLNLWGTLAGALGSLLLAAATHRLIENPIRFHPRLASRPWLSLALAGCATSACVGLSVGCYYAVHWFENQQTRQVWNLIRTKPGVYDDGCQLNLLQMRSPGCVYGDAASSRTLVLFGDSHASQWFPPLQAIAEEKHWKLVVRTKVACTPVAVMPYDDRHHRDYRECAAWRDGEIDSVIRMHPQAVVLSTYSSYYIRHLHLSMDAWSEALRQTVARFDRAGVTVVLLHDPPEPTTDVTDCVYRWAREGKDVSSCSFQRATGESAAIAAAEEQVVKTMQHTRLLDLSAAICAQPECSAYRNGTIVYQDRHHLSVSFARTMAPLLGEKLESVLNGVDYADTPSIREQAQLQSF